MNGSNAQKIEAFLSKWRVASSDLLRSSHLGIEALNPHFLSETLRRLRRKEKIFSVRIRDSWYHFDEIFRRRFEFLKALPTAKRERAFRSGGFDHHIKVVDVGLKLHRLFPDLEITPNIFSDHVSFTFGTRTRSDKKYAPDLVISSKSDLKKGIYYMEVEQSQKAERRYAERWDAYEADPILYGCLYVTYDFNFAKRLAERMRRYVQEGLARPTFFLGCLTSDEFEKKGLDASVWLYRSEGSEKRLLREILR